MGFFQGVARAYGEISERKEREGARKEEVELRKSERAEDKKDKLEFYKMQLGDSRTTKLLELEAQRLVAQRKAEEYSLAPSALRSVLGDYAETPAGKSWLKTAEQYPDGAKQALEIWNSSDRVYTPEEFVNGITIVGSPGNSGIIEMLDIESIDTSDPEAYVDAIAGLTPPSRPESQVVIAGTLKDEYASQEVKLAREEFTTTAQELAMESLSHLEGFERENHPVQKLLNIASNGDESAIYKINRMFAAPAAERLQDSPYFPAISSLPLVDAGMEDQVYLKLINSGKLKQDRVDRLKAERPWLFERY